jgi:predicted transcriptional regulator
LTVRLPAETKNNLARLAEKTRRTSSFLAADAIAAFVARELDIVEGIAAAEEDIRHGRLTPHEDVANQVKQVIAASRKQQ